MKTILMGLLLAFSLGAAAAPMSNDDVVKMAKAGLSDAVIIQSIDAADNAFDTSADGLIKLKQGGASDAVIQRIVTKKGVAPAAAAAAVPAAPPVCHECGTVTGINEIAKPGKASGVGAGVGAVAGGLLGRAVGGHNHRTAGTLVGAAGGAVAGHMIEKSASAGKTFQIGVRFDDGSSRSFSQDSHPGWGSGSRVKLVNGVLTSL